MTRLDFDPELERLGDALHAGTTIDLAREHEAASAHRPELHRVRPPRSRILAGSTLGLAGVGAALVLAVSGSAAPPAFAVTKSDNGSVLVNLNYNINQNLPEVNRKLAELGTGEQITIDMASGPAAVSGAVACTPAPGVSGPPVKVLVGKDGTETIGPGQSAGNTAQGSFHLEHCTTTSGAGSGNTGAG